MTPDMQAPPSLGIAHFLSQTDVVGIALFIILILMSALSWSLIIARVRRMLALQQRSAAFIAQCRNANDIDTLRHLADAGQQHVAQARLAKAAFDAVDGHRGAGSVQGTSGRSGAAGTAALIALDSPRELVARSLQQSIDDESARLEHGQTSLASIASSAPFVGLFGTVWGIYHALISIGATGQSSLDQVAGPVGEALIMTALGLAVAIPAALAYNAFQRQTRMRTADLERFAHEFFLRLASGTPERR